MKLNKHMIGLHNILKQNKRKWENHLYQLWILEYYDGRTLNALKNRGLLEIHYSDHDGIGKEGYYVRPLPEDYKLI